VKPHYHVLDGLRGAAAFGAVMFRLAPRVAGQPGRGLTLDGFFARGVIRLHPMVVAAMVIGLLGYLLDPYAGNAQRVGGALSPGMLALTFELSMLFLRAPTLPGETHPSAARRRRCSKAGLLRSPLSPTASTAVFGAASAARFLQVNQQQWKQS
jgi:hypothetical protein